MSKRRLSTKDAARLVGVHPQTLRGWTRRGLLTPVPVRDWRGARVFTAADVERRRARSPGRRKGALDVLDTPAASLVTNL